MRSTRRRAPQTLSPTTGLTHFFSHTSAPLTPRPQCPICAGQVEVSPCWPDTLTAGTCGLAVKEVSQSIGDAAISPEPLHGLVDPSTLPKRSIPTCRWWRCGMRPTLLGRTDGHGLEKFPPARGMRQVGKTYEDVSDAGAKALPNDLLSSSISRRLNDSSSWLSAARRTTSHSLESRTRSGRSISWRSNRSSGTG